MATKSDRLWESLANWNPTAFMIAGVALLSGFGIGVWELFAFGERLVAIPEWFVAIFTITGLVAVYVGLLGFYTHVAEASPRLAIGGVLAAGVGGASLAVLLVGKTVLDLLGIIGFTDEGPLLPLFFVIILGTLASFLLYGLASVRSKTPSRIVGGLLLVPIVEPISVILFDLLVVVDVGSAGLLATSGIYSASLLAIGYLLRTETGSTDHPQSAGDPAT